MGFKPRPYQQQAINIGVDFLRDEKKKYNGLLILPTGAGKSIVVAEIANALHEDVLILQPSKEILVQNYAKYISYGNRAGIYSDSGGGKHVDRVTFATIGSVINKIHLFKKVKYILIDECHLCNAEDGMYKNFLSALPGAKVLGMTASPYRLTSDFEGAMLRFITNTNPRIFSKVLYVVQNEELFAQGFLSKLEYFSFNVIDRTRLQMNVKGTDFTDSSIRSLYREINMPAHIIKYARYVLTKRKNLLIFCSLISEAQKVAAGIPGSVVIHGETDQTLRDNILTNFKRGIITCVVNVGVLVVGFDYPGLQAVMFARSTMSLAIWYQAIGRGIRIDQSKDCCWIIDLGNNLEYFGKVETLRVEKDRTGKYFVSNGGRRLTDIVFKK